MQVMHYLDWSTKYIGLYMIEGMCSMLRNPVYSCTPRCRLRSTWPLFLHETA